MPHRACNEIILPLPLYIYVHVLWKQIIYELHLKANVVPEFCLFEEACFKNLLHQNKTFNFWIYNEYRLTSAHVSIFLIVSFFLGSGGNILIYPFLNIVGY